MPLSNILVDAVKASWKYISALAIIAAASFFIYNKGFAQCELEHKAADAENLRKTLEETQKQIDEHAKREAELQRQLGDVIKQRDKLAHEKLERRRKGEQIVKEDSVNRDCVVPDASLQYLEQVYSGE